MNKKDDGNDNISCVVVDPSDNKLKSGEKAGDATKVLGKTEQEALKNGMPSIGVNVDFYEVGIGDDGKLYKKINGKKIPIGKTVDEAKKLIDEKGIPTTIKREQGKGR